MKKIIFLIAIIMTTLNGQAQKTHSVGNGGLLHIITVNDTTNKIESIKINNSEWIDRKDVIAGRFIEYSATSKYISLLFASLGMGSAVLAMSSNNQATIAFPIVFLGTSMGFHITSIRKQEIGGKLMRGHWRFGSKKPKRVKRIVQQGEHPNPLF